MVRRLPVLNVPATEDGEAEARPAWQWVAIGAALVLVLFLPLSVVGVFLGAELARAFQGGPTLAALPTLVLFAGSAFAAGAITGRFGRRAGPSSALLAGALGGALVLLLAALGRAFASWTVASAAAIGVLSISSGFSWLGARLGKRLRA